jgi:Ca-activated chloride channel homolog
MQWPGFLVFLLVVPLLVILYRASQRRRRRLTLRYSSLSLVSVALPSQSRIKKYLPPVLYLLALSSLVIALTRPVLLLDSPTGQATMILVLDVSNSMSKPDVQPTRLGAAKLAALSYIRAQKANMQIGLVTFSSSAQIIQEPTADREQLETAVQSLTVGDNTAIGMGIYEALNIIAHRHNRTLPPAPDDGSTGQSPWAGPVLPKASPTAADSLSPTPGSAQKAFVPEIIVILTDGSNNTGPRPNDVARMAVGEGVRVYTIGYGPEYANGSKHNAPDLKKIIPNTGSALPLPLNTAMQELKEIASITGGKDYTAASAGELEKVLTGLPIQRMAKKKPHEISMAFVALGGLLAVGAMAFGALWRPLP